MKRLVVLALAMLVSCQKPHAEPVPPPPKSPAPPSASAPGPGQPPRVTPAVPATIAGVTPAPGDFKIKDFAFTSGEKLPELRIHYMTLGTPRRDAAGHVTNAVLIMHGTTGSGQQFARKQFADELF